MATDLANYGLDRPPLKITFSAYASQNTAETTAGEEPLETILFGKTEGGNVYAKLQDEPFIVSVPQSVLAGIYTDPLKWQDLAIYHFKTDDIVGLDITKEGQATLSLVKEKGQWKPAKGDIGLNAAAVQSLANTLATLRAVQWTGAAKPGQGLEKPAVTVAFTTADKQVNTVKCGGPAGDYWNASATGWTGAFEMSRPDHDTFTADFLQSAKASPAASASPGAVELAPPVTTAPVPAR